MKQDDRKTNLKGVYFHRICIEGKHTGSFQPIPFRLYSVLSFFKNLYCFDLLLISCHPE